MNTHNSWRIRAALALALAATLALSACAGTGAGPNTGAESATPTVSSTKEARLELRDFNLCIENKSSSRVTVEWHGSVSTFTATGTLAVGETACGEGKAPKSVITFADAFSTALFTRNPPLAYPFLSFNKFPLHGLYCRDGFCEAQGPGDEYASARYAQGETVGSDVEGHHFAVTRNADDDWIQFTIVILD